ncbi:MAG TPA: hypothetical protein VGE21_13730 [Flavobacteriales bacterium]
MNTTLPQRHRTLLWVVFALSSIGLVVDCIDGYLPKILMSVGITLGLGALLIRQRSSAPAWRYLGMAGILLALGAMVYRLATYLSA